jgi:hypothetical protein
MIRSKRKALLLGLLFLSGVVVLDQALSFFGAAMVRSGHWKDGLLPALAAVPDQDVYLLGGCRAAINFDSKLIAERTGKSVFNAAAVADGLGNIDFALGVLLSHHSKGQVVFVIDDGNWEETGETVRPEIERRLIWWNLLDDKERRELSDSYDLQPLLLRSGFWRFKGEGKDMAKAALKWAARKPVTAAKDGYVPRAAGQNIIPNLVREADLRAEIRQDFRPSAFAEARIDDMVRRAMAGGLRPILVIAPMHRFRATDEVNRLQTERMGVLAAKYKLGFLSYVDNHGVLAGNDTVWSDAGHMNRLGSEAFSASFAADLAGLEAAQ